MSRRDVLYQQILGLTNSSSQPSNSRNSINSRNLKLKMKKYQRLIILMIAVVSAIFFIIYYYKYQNLYHVMDMLDSISSQPDKRNLSTLHDKEHKNEHRRMYRWFWMKMTENIDVYSAYHDRDNKTMESVKVFGTISKEIDETKLKLKCLLWYARDKKPDESTVTVTPLQPGTKKNSGKFKSVMFRCHVLRANGVAPYGITLMDLSNIHERNETYRLLKVLPTERTHSKNKDVSVCVLPPISGPYDDLKEVIQFLEMYKLIGFQRFVFYDFSSSDRIQHLLLEYVKETDFSVEVMHWNFPHQSALDANSILLAKNDCLYRTMSHSYYTLFVNLYSYIVPRKSLNITNIINSAIKLLSPNSLPVLTFSKGFFCDEYPDDKGKKLLQINFKVLVKTYRHPTLHITRQRSVLLIPVKNIDYVKSDTIISALSNGEIVYKSIGQFDALVHVYQSCENFQIGHPNDLPKRHIYDASALLYKDKLLSSKLMGKIQYQY